MISSAWNHLSKKLISPIYHSKMNLLVFASSVCLWWEPTLWISCARLDVSSSPKGLLSLRRCAVGSLGWVPALLFIICEIFYILICTDNEFKNYKWLYRNRNRIADCGKRPWSTLVLFLLYNNFHWNLFFIFDL